MDFPYSTGLAGFGTRTTVAIDLYNLFNSNTGTAYNQTYDPRVAFSAAATSVDQGFAQAG